MASITQKLVVIDEYGNKHAGYFESDEEYKKQKFRDNIYLASMLVGILASTVAILIGYERLKNKIPIHLKD